MRASPVVMCCWPGLPKLWLSGDWSALVVAVAFGGVLNLLLVFSLARPAWLPAAAGTLAWMTLGGLWLVSTVRAYRKWPNLCLPAASADNRGLFLQAQGEYLQGHWYEAESLLRELLRLSHRDCDARLMLATLYRHTNRYNEAVAELGRMEQLDGAEKWLWEIAAERRLVRKKCEFGENGSIPEHS
jgi:tetratricopeptide (TPR) repeat protein